MKITILSGAGMSAESGLSTFRGSNGLWEKFSIEDVASIDGWNKDPAKVLDFYNQRRIQLKSVQPNIGHLFLAEQQRHYDITIVTQNVDDLHERAGSQNVVHLHGELTKAKSTKRGSNSFYIGYQSLTLQDKCPNGFQLRPDVVWFGEEVPLLLTAAKIIQECQLLIVVGTSLNVYPAASLINFVQQNTKIIAVDPNYLDVKTINFRQIIEPASTGIKKAFERFVF